MPLFLLFLRSYPPFFSAIAEDFEKTGPEDVVDRAFQFPSSDAERTSVDARRRRGRALRVRIVLYGA